MNKNLVLCSPIIEKVPSYTLQKYLDLKISITCVLWGLKSQELHRKGGITSIWFLWLRFTWIQHHCTWLTWTQIWAPGYTWVHGWVSPSEPGFTPSWPSWHYWLDRGSLTKALMQNKDTWWENMPTPFLRIPIFYACSYLLFSCGGFGWGSSELLWWINE